MVQFGNAWFAFVAKKLRMHVVALIGRRLVHFERNAMGVGPGVLTNARHLPGDLDIGLVGLDRENAVGDFRRDPDLGGLSERGELIAEIAIQRFEPARHGYNSRAARVGDGVAVIDIHHVRRFDEGVVEVLVGGIRGMVDHKRSAGFGERVENRAVYVALGVDLEGHKEVLGLWSSGNEGAKFWLSVLTELRNRGVKDMLIVCVDGLKGFPQAIETVFPLAQVQLCIVHLVRASLNYVNWKERKQVAADLKPIYRAATAVEAEMNLESFMVRWDKYKAIGKLWKENWEHVIPFFAFPEEVRKVIYTTNAVEGLHRGLRKIIRNRGSFPSEEAALKLLYLALQNISAKWETVQSWKEALNQFEILWGDRIRAARRP
jgi:putative transposase